MIMIGMGAIAYIFLHSAKTYYNARIVYHAILFNIFFIIIVAMLLKIFLPNVVVTIEKELGEFPGFTLNDKMCKIVFLNHITIKSLAPLKVNGKVYEKGNYTIKLKDEKK